ncbi:MAG: PAS domain S-box protein [Acidobacteriota bacterium]
MPRTDRIATVLVRAIDHSLAHLDELPTLIWRSGPDGKCDYLNRGWLRFTGRTLDEELGDGWIRNVHPDDLASCLEVFQTAVRTQQFFETEYRLRRHDGQYRWVIDRANPMFDAAGRYQGHIGSCTDITAHKLAENALRRHELLSENARDAILLVGPKGEILEANSAAEKMYGYKRAEILKLTLRDLRPPERRAGIRADLERAWKAGILFETLHVRKDGTRFAVEVNAQATEVDGERVLISIIRDATDRYRMEQQLRTSESKYRSLFENMREGVAIHDAVYGAQGTVIDYRITDVNPAFSSHTGLRREAVIGRLGSEIYGTGVAPFLDHYSRVVATGQPASFETFFGPLNRHLSVSAFSLGNGQFAVVLADVTERKRVDEQLRQAQKMEAVGRLAGGIAHDFNNLLTIILAYGDMLLESLPDGPLRQGIDSINEAGERAAKLTSQLLTFSRKQVVQPHVLDLNQLVAETGDMVRRIIGEDIVFEIVAGQNLRLVRVDPGQIQQVIMNLVVNARDAMPNGGKLTIETANVSIQGGLNGSGVPRGGYVLLSVGDTGIGMSSEVQSHLFEPFFTTKPKGQGTGLGLSTVYGIVKQCGGEVVVESEPGKGTRFDLYLPAAFGEKLAEKRTRGVAQRTARGETILLVEDEPDVRELVSQLLTGLGYHVLQAPEGCRALDILSDQSLAIHLLLTDVVMPNMTGPEMATRAATIRPGLPVLFISGYPDVSIAGRGLDINADNFVQKPFTSDVLSAKIRQLIENRS